MPDAKRTTLHAPCGGLWSGFISLIEPSAGLPSAPGLPPAPFAMAISKEFMSFMAVPLDIVPIEVFETELGQAAMTPDQQQWLERAKELAARIERRFEAEPADNGLVMALTLHMQTLRDTPEWHDEQTLDTFLQDMLPLATCCASLEACLPRAQSDTVQIAWVHIYLAGKAVLISSHLLAALEWRLKSVTTPPRQSLIKPLLSSASVAVRWCPKALRAATGAQLGQVAEMGGPLSPRELGLLKMAGDAADVTVSLLRLVKHGGELHSTLRATLCSPAALASTLANLAAVYACFARFPATFKGQASEWFKLTELAGTLLAHPDNQLEAAAVEEDADARLQLAAALLPYSTYLLKAADLQNASWNQAWGHLVMALSAQAMWPNAETAAARGIAQCSAAVQEGLLRLLRALPPLSKPPPGYDSAWDWAHAPLSTAKAAAAAATKALSITERVLVAQLEQVAGLREVVQQGLNMTLALLPITVGLLSAAAELLAGQAASAGAGGVATPHPLPWFGYIGLLKQLLLLLTASELLFDAGSWERLDLQAQPGELAAAAEAALRLSAQAAVLSQPRGVGPDMQPLVTALHGTALRVGACLSRCLPDTAKQEVSAGPVAGGVCPSLQAQLRFVHTACKFAYVAFMPGGIASSAAGGGVWVESLQKSVHHLLEIGSYLVFSHMHAEDIPPERAPLAPEEKRALIGTALALGAASSAVVHLLPEGAAREAVRFSNSFLLCRLLAQPELAGSLLAQHAGLARELVGGLAAGVKRVHANGTEAQTSLGICFKSLDDAVQGTRRLAPMLLGGAAGEALEAAVRQGLQGPTHEGVVLRTMWCRLLRILTWAAHACFDLHGWMAAVRLWRLLPGPDDVQELQQEGWDALRALRAAADEWLAQEEQQQWRQEQLLLCAEAAATRTCSNLACTNLGGASEAGLRAKRCAGCQCVRYCSTACQRVDWAAGHKAACKRLQAGKAAGG